VFNFSTLVYVNQFITPIGLFYKKVWILLGGCLTVKN